MTGMKERTTVQWLADETKSRPGRDIIFDYLRHAEVDRMYGVPGTNEIPLIDATDDPERQVKYVPCLHENIALGAAMGYARTRRASDGGVVPGVVELHVTPGIGHALGNLYNAFKSHIPVVVLCGQQHSNLLIQEPLLGSDIAQVAQQYTKWSYEVRGPNEIGMAMQRALKTALAPPMGPVFLSIPWEFLVQNGVDPYEGKFTRIAPRFQGQPSEVDRAAQLLGGANYPVIVAGDGVGEADAWAELESLAKTIGAPVYTEQLSSYCNYPNHLAHGRGELPGVQEKIRRVLGEMSDDQGNKVARDVIFLCGFNAQSQLVVYKWEDGPLIPAHLQQVYLHDDPWEIGKNHYGSAAVLGDIKDALPKLTNKIRANQNDEKKKWVDELNTHLKKEDEQQQQKFEDKVKAGKDTPISPAVVVNELQKLVKDRSLRLVNEAISDTPDFQQGLVFESPTSYLAAEGGSLGYSMPASLGVADALFGRPETQEHDPDRKRPIVVNAVGDGSALFYLHTWWTAAKLRLPVLYLITNNKQYKTLRIGLEILKKAYEWTPIGTAEYLKLEGEPKLSFEKLANAFGIQAKTVEKAGQLANALKTAVEVVDSGYPYVLEVLTDSALPNLSKVDISSNGHVTNALQGDQGEQFIWNFGPA